MTGILAGRTALVVGASGGIGRATAQALAAAGARIMVADLDERVAETAEILQKSGAEAAHIVVDARSEGQIKDMIARTHDNFGKIDIVHYNAAALSPAQLERDNDVVGMDLAIWDQAMAVNVRGALLTAKHAIPAMIASGGGSIVLSGSARGIVADLRATAYSVSKAALHHLARNIATQYGKQNIRCNAIAIGVVMTEKAAAMLPDAIQESLTQRHLTPALGTPESIADAVVFLASDASRFITGTILDLDGGFRAHIGFVGRP